jgi:hypothetical protein
MGRAARKAAPTRAAPVSAQVEYLRSSTRNALSTHHHRTPSTYVNALTDARLHPGTYCRADRRRQASRDAAHLWDASGVVERAPEPSFWTFS